MQLRWHAWQLTRPWVLPTRDLDLEFEVPFRELVFDGVPHRSAAKMMPTVNCLVELQEVPALAGQAV